MESKGKLSAEANTVLMWMNTCKSDPKYSKGLIYIRYSLEPELQDSTSSSTNTGMIAPCTANLNLSLSTIGYKGAS